MVKINFYIQVLMFIALLVLVTVGIEVDYEYFRSIILLQIPVGVTQYIGSVCLKFFQSSESRRLSLHLTISTLCLVLPVAWEGFNFDFNEELFIVFVIGIPWLLAIFYWFISYKLYKPVYG